MLCYFVFDPAACVRHPSGRRSHRLRSSRWCTSPIRIYDTIFKFLLEDNALAYTEAPMIRVQRQCTDLATGEPLAQKEPFIESLTHDSYIIQIPQLHGQHRTEVEAMLQLFDQNRISGDRYRLVIEEAEIPERYRPLLRRLQRVVAEPAIADAMDLEDEVLQELQDRERTIERERAEKEKEREQADQGRAEKERLLVLLK